MPHKAVYLLVVDGFADWEPAHAVGELRRHGQYRVESVGLASAPVQPLLGRALGVCGPWAARSGCSS